MPMRMSLGVLVLAIVSLAGITPAVAAAQAGAFFDAVEREFGGAADDGKHREVAQHGEAIVAPFAHGDHAAVDGENRPQFPAVECDLFRQAVLGGERYRRKHRHDGMMTPVRG